MTQREVARVQHTAGSVAQIAHSVVTLRAVKRVAQLKSVDSEESGRVVLVDGSSKHALPRFMVPDTTRKAASDHGIA